MIKSPMFPLMLAMSQCNQFDLINIFIPLSDVKRQERKKTHIKPAPIITKYGHTTSTSTQSLSIKGKNKKSFFTCIQPIMPRLPQLTLLDINLNLAGKSGETVALGISGVFTMTNGEPNTADDFNTLQCTQLYILVDASGARTLREGVIQGFSFGSMLLAECT